MFDELSDPNQKASDAVAPVLLDDKGAIKVDQRRSVKIDHAGAANMVLKHINTVPNLSIEGRLIMSMKVMNPGLKNRIIAHEMKISEYDVLMYEGEAIKKCADHVRKMRLEDSVEKFNLDKYDTTNIGKLNRNKDNPLITGVNQNQ